MLYKIKDDLWYDNEKIFIIKGDYNRYMFTQEYDKYPECNNKRTEHKFPKIIFLSSMSCNLKCSYCFAEEGTYKNKSEKKFFELEDYKYIYECTERQYGWVRSINFFGGEPLLNFGEIKKFVEYLYEKYSVESVPSLAIQTNGTIMNNEIKAFLMKYNIKFCTSLDGPKEFNDLNRIGTSIESVYDKVTETLSNLSDLDTLKAFQVTLNKEHLVNYKKGDVVQWVKEFEKLPIDFYEAICVTTDDLKYKIDLTDRVIYDNYVQLCSDLADHCLNLITMEDTLIMPHIFAGIMLHIIKRESQEDCEAGFSFSATPSRRIFPCHVCADDDSYGIDCSESFVKDAMQHEKYQSVAQLGKEVISACKQCIAIKLCPYVCKGMMVKGNYKMLEERCVMMKVFTEKVILFLSEVYPSNKEIVKRNLIEMCSMR